MATKKTKKESYEAARATYRKTGSETSKKSFMKARQAYIDERKQEQEKGN